MVMEVVRYQGSGDLNSERKIVDEAMTELCSQLSSWWTGNGVMEDSGIWQGFLLKGLKLLQAWSNAFLSFQNNDLCFLLLLYSLRWGLTWQEANGVNIGRKIPAADSLKFLRTRIVGGSAGRRGVFWWLKEPWKSFLSGNHCNKNVRSLSFLYPFFPYKRTSWDISWCLVANYCYKWKSGLCFLYLHPSWKDISWKSG